MKHLFIINPAAGKTMTTGDLENMIKTAAESRGADYEIVYTQRRDHATELARAACETGEELRIYACGGDGTLNEVVNGAVGFKNAAVTQVPTGTGNDFVKIFGSDCDKFRDIGLLLDSEVRPLDVIKCCGRYSLNVCSVGFDARIGTEVHKYTGIPLVGGKLAYDISVVVNLIKGIHQHMKVSADGEEMEGRYTLICACNGRYYGGGYNPVPEAEPDSGYIECLVVNKVSRLMVAKLIGKYAKGRYRELPKYVKKIRTKKLTVSLDRESPVNIDGELGFGREITFEVPEEKVNFFFPRGCSYRASVVEKEEVTA